MFSGPRSDQHLGTLSSWRSVMRARLSGAQVSLNQVTLTPDCDLARGCRVFHHATIVASRIARYSYVGTYSKLNFAEVGPFCAISWDVTIGSGHRHPYQRITNHAFPDMQSFGLNGGYQTEAHHETVDVGADVWIGSQATIMAGVKIGHGAIIGAGAVVTRDVSDYHIVAGVPATYLRHRFPPEMAQELLEMRWWDWPDALIRRNASLFRQPLDGDVLAQLRCAADEYRRAQDRSSSCLSTTGVSQVDEQIDAMGRG